MPLQFGAVCKANITVYMLRYEWNFYEGEYFAER
jgi:hypothetical protein